MLSVIKLLMFVHLRNGATLPEINLGKFCKNHVIKSISRDYLPGGDVTSASQNSLQGGTHFMHSMTLLKYCD